MFNFINPDSETLYQQDKIPDLINNYFSEIGPKLASEILANVDGELITGIPNPHVFELNEFILPDLLCHIKSISIYKSSGFPNLSTRFLKDVMLYIPQVFLHLYNIVRLSGIFPDPWKSATVIPLPKCNEPKNPSELRPISLLPLVGKILEKLIHKQLSSFLENTNYLTNMQHGFRESHSTTSATARFLDDIMLDLDKGNPTMAVFLDIKKAFDTINHEILINKLQHAGLGENTLRLLTNYLNNRNQAVLYNGKYSENKTLITGVPQRSTLGPLLFLVYINDRPNVLSKSKCLMFADDTVLYHTNPMSVMLSQESQTDLDFVYKWCQKNFITLNIAKSQYINFGYRKNNNEDMQLKLGNTLLDKVQSYKYLGTIIDEKLNGEAQYSRVMQILSGKKITFSKIRHLMNTSTASLIYKSTIQPIFDYNDFYYYMLNQNNLQKLQSMQNRFLRIVYRNDNICTEEMQARIGTGKLEYTRDLHLCGQMYRCSRVPEYLDQRDLPTRQFDKIVLKAPDVILTKTFKSPIYKGSQLWNALPQQIKKCNTYKDFKYQYKQHALGRL